MGSSNIACALTNLSISPGDKIYWIPLIPTDFQYRYTNKRCYKLFNKKKKRAEKSKNIHHFLKPNKAELKYIDDYESKGDLDLKKYNSGQVTLYPMSHIVSNDGACEYYSPAFTPIECTYNDYNTVKDIIKSKSTEFFEDISGGRPIEEMVNFCLRYSISSDDYKKAKPLWKMLSGCFIRKDAWDILYEKVKDKYTYQSRFKKAYENYKESKLDSVLLEMMAHILCLKKGLYCSDKSEENLNRKIIKYLEDPVFFEEVIKLHTLKTTMYGLNKLFEPTLKGPQDGDRELERLFYRTISNLINKGKK